MAKRMEPWLRGYYKMKELAQTGLISASWQATRPDKVINSEVNNLIRQVGLIIPPAVTDLLN